MRAVVQRVSQGRLLVDGRVTGEMKPASVVPVAIARGDGPGRAVSMAEKIANLRVLSDKAEGTNRPLLEMGGAVLAVSQFTLSGDARGQRRPSLAHAAPPRSRESTLRRICASGIDVLEMRRDRQGVGVAASPVGQLGIHMAYGLGLASTTRLVLTP